MITDSGKDLAAGIQLPVVAPPVTILQSPSPVTTPVTTPVAGLPPDTSGPHVATQAELFRSDGDLLAYGTRKGDLTLDTIVRYVERVANLDDLDSIWNALTEIRIPNDLKKRWLKLYAPDVQSTR